MVEHKHYPKKGEQIYGATSGCNHESGPTPYCIITYLATCRCGANGRYCAYHGHWHWS